MGFNEFGAGGEELGFRVKDSGFRVLHKQMRMWTWWTTSLRASLTIRAAYFRSLRLLLQELHNACVETHNSWQLIVAPEFFNNSLSVGFRSLASLGSMV